MGKAISTDLRERVVRVVEAGKSRRVAAEHFDVSIASAVRFVQLYQATGSVEPRKQGRPRGSGKLAPHRDFLIAEVERTPDISMPKLAARLLAERGVTVDPSNLSKFLISEGYSYKKRFWPRSRNAPT